MVPNNRFGIGYYRAASVLLFPLMPAFVLANRVYYLQVEFPMNMNKIRNSNICPLPE